MNWLRRLFAQSVEQRSAAAASTTWDLLRTGVVDSHAGVAVSPYLAENLSVVYGCVQIISETVGMLPLCTYRKMPDGSREEARNHPIAAVFQGEANDWQTGAELVEMLTAYTLLRGVGYAEIEFDGRGAPVALRPFHPDWVSLVTIRRSATTPPTYGYDVSLPQGGARRLLPEQMFVLRDRTDDGAV
jgi:HK97 family phage portal protein